MRVALIDDDRAVLDSLSLYLAREGFAVDCFESADTFLAETDRAKNFDCIISDVRMPGLSGLDLVHRLTEENRTVPLILITGHGDVETAVKAIKMGAFDFLEKPFDERKLVEAIRLVGARAAETSRQDAYAIEVTRRLASLSDRIGNVIVQLPVTVLMAKFRKITKSGEFAVDLAWHPNIGVYEEAGETCNHCVPAGCFQP